MEIYDSLTDRWSIIHVSMSNPMEEVSILEDSLAVQINEAQLYVFGGRNSNKYLVSNLVIRLTLVCLWKSLKFVRRSRLQPR